MLSRAPNGERDRGGESKEAFTKRKRDEIEKTWYTGKVQGHG